MTQTDKLEIINVFNSLKKTIQTLKDNNSNNQNDLQLNILETKLLIFESEHGHIIYNKDEKNEHLQVSFKCPITNAYNHKYFNEQINFIINNDNFKHLSIAIVKINDLFNINNRYGYKAGDQVLKTATDNIFSVVKNNDNIEVVRFYGSEFRILFYNQNKDDVFSILYKLKKVMQKSKVPLGNGITVPYETIMSMASKQSENDNITQMIDRAFKTAMSIVNNTEDVYIAEDKIQIETTNINNHIENNTTYEDIIGAFSFQVKNKTIDIAGDPMVIRLNENSIYYGE